MTAPRHHPTALLAALLTLGAAAPSTLAQPLTGLFEWQVSADSGATWASSITINPGAAYMIRGRGGWTDGLQPSIGLAGATFEQIDLIGADSTDVFGGASGVGGIPTCILRREWPVGVEDWSLQPGTGASAVA